MDFGNLGKLIVVMGVVLVVVGGAIWGLSKTGLPLGRLPGDIRLVGQQASCYAPIVTMLLLSVVLTIVINVILWLLRH